MFDVRKSLFVLFVTALSLPLAAAQDFYDTRIEYRSPTIRKIYEDYGAIEKDVAQLEERYERLHEDGKLSDRAFENLKRELNTREREALTRKVEALERECGGETPSRELREARAKMAESEAHYEKLRREGEIDEKEQRYLNDMTRNVFQMELLTRLGELERTCKPVRYYRVKLSYDERLEKYREKVEKLRGDRARYAALVAEGKFEQWVADHLIGTLRDLAEMSRVGLGIKEEDRLSLDPPQGAVGDANSRVEKSPESSFDELR